jgi:hypothetical protein
MCSDTCQTTSHDESQDIAARDVGGSDAEVGESPEPLFPEIKAEREVSCVCALIITHFTTTVCTHISS